MQELNLVEIENVSGGNLLLVAAIAQRVYAAMTTSGEQVANSRMDKMGKL